MALDPIEKYLGEANYMADRYPSNTELQEIIRKKLEEQGYEWDGERGYDDFWRDYSKEVTDNQGNKYYFHITVLVAIIKNNPGEIGHNDITFGLDVYRDKSLLRRMFSKNKKQKVTDISFGYKGNTQTAKKKDISNGVDFEQPNEIRKAVLQRTPSAVRKLEDTALDRINRMPDPSTLKENAEAYYAKISKYPPIQRAEEIYWDAFGWKPSFDSPQEAIEWMERMIDQYVNPKHNWNKKASKTKQENLIRIANSVINDLKSEGNLNENMNEKSRWAKLAGLPEPKELLNENIGGVVSIGAINNIFDREKEKYEDAFEYFLKERYEKEEIEENYASEVRDAWPSLPIETRVELLLSVFDDPDMAESMAEKSFDELPEAAKANMRMDMLGEGFGLDDMVVGNKPTTPQPNMELLKKAFYDGAHAGRTSDRENWTEKWEEFKRQEGLHRFD